MTQTSKVRLFGGFTAAIIITLAVGLLSYFALNRQTGDAEITRHTYQVINRLQTLQNMVLRMANSRAGYRATGSAVSLSAYHAAAPQVAPLLTDIEALIRDNNAQTARLSALRTAVEELEVFWKIQNNQRTESATIAENKLITLQESNRLNAVKNMLDLMEREEQTLLRQRLQRTRDATRNVVNQIAIGTLLGLAVVVVLIVMILKEFNQRSRVQENLRLNLKELHSLNESVAYKNWLLTGAREIRDVMSGQERVADIAASIVGMYVRFLELPAGAFHLAAAGGQLRRIFSLGVAEEASAETASALVQRAVAVGGFHVLPNIPKDYWKLRSATGEALPGSIGLCPLYYNEALLGVIELASFGVFEDRAKDFINTTQAAVASAVQVCKVQEQATHLLEQVQSQSEELITQQEELRQANEELRQHSESLQASEEELRVQSEELTQMNAELLERNEAVETARVAVQEKAKDLEVTNRYKSEFLANMSHELRTPLNSVLILAKLLAENAGGNLTAKQQEWAGVIHKSGSDLLTLINDILDLSKIEAGKVDFLFEEVSAESILRDIKAQFEAIASDRNIAFETRVEAGDLPALYTDKARLEQILKNLLSNAFKFTPKEGKVTLQIGKSGSGKALAFAVKDTGIGIAPDKHQLVFEAFKQADGSTSRRYGGTGLGLSISRELAHKLGGTITLRSATGEGSTFTVTVPVEGPENQVRQLPVPHRPEAEVVAAATAPETVINAPEQNLVADDRTSISATDKTMLIVEDDTRFAAIIRDFARERGYKTLVALQGDEGLMYARRYKPAAIILDMQLPVIDGWTLLKILKAEEGLQHIPVHIISAVDKSLVSLSGALAHLRKPVEKADLEGAFELLAQHTRKKIQNVLLWGSGRLAAGNLTRLLSSRDAAVSVKTVGTFGEAQEALSASGKAEDSAGSYQCIVTDLEGETGPSLSKIEALKTKSSGAAVMLYLSEEVTPEEERRMSSVADILIQESAQSKERLIEEIELFLYKMQVSQKGGNTRAAEEASTLSLQGRKVLLVDDDMRNVFALTSLLEGYQMDIHTAMNGREALEMMDTHPDTELVLMDIMMPEMDGYEAMRRLRTDKRFLHLPVIALTAKAMLGDREKTLEAGASDYITKPVDGARLLSLMRVWLAK